MIRIDKTLRRYYYRWQTKRAAKVLLRLDGYMIAAGLSRAHRRKMWRALIKSQDVRDDLYLKMLGGK